MEIVRNYVEALFSSLPKTKEVMEIKLNMIENLEDKYQELLAEGTSEQEVVGIMLSQIGTVEELKKELGISEQELSAELDRKNREDKLETVRQEYFEFRKTYARSVAGAVILFILSPMLFVLLDTVRLGRFSIVAFFVCIAAGVGILININMEDGRYKERLGVGDRAAQDSKDPTARRRNARYEAASGILWVSTVAVYLMMGFLLQLWHPGWIIFLVSTVIQIMMDYLFKASEGNQ